MDKFLALSPPFSHLITQLLLIPFLSAKDIRPFSLFVAESLSRTTRYPVLLPFLSLTPSPADSAKAVLTVTFLGVFLVQGSS
jgi:hypothetical protein